MVSCWRSWALKLICPSSVPGSLLATWPWNSLSSFYLLVFVSNYSLITAYYLTGLWGFRKQCQWVLFTSLLGISGIEWSIWMREVSRGCEMFELSLGGWVGVWSAQNTDGAPGMGCQHDANLEAEEQNSGVRLEVCHVEASGEWLAVSSDGGLHGREESQVKLQYTINFLRSLQVKSQISYCLHEYSELPDLIFIFVVRKMLSLQLQTK